MTSFLYGAIMLASFVIALFFARFWRESRDRFFAIFSLAFVLLGVERIILQSLDTDNEARSWVYVIRLVAFALIIAAILQKNRRNRSQNSSYLVHQK